MALLGSVGAAIAALDAMRGEGSIRPAYEAAAQCIMGLSECANG